MNKVRKEIEDCQNLQDSDLWNQFCSGNKKALKTVYDRCAKECLIYGYKLCKDKAIVEDALQEIIIRFWEKRASLPEVTNIKSYIFTAIRRKIFRKMMYKPQWESLDEHDFLFENHQFSINEGVFDHIPERENLSSDVRRMVSQLSSRQKEIVYLKYFEGMDYEEIEKIMGINYQSSRNLLSKALKNLRDLMVFIYMISLFQ